MMDFELCGSFYANYPLYRSHSIVKIQSPGAKSKVRLVTSTVQYNDTIIIQ